MTVTAFSYSSTSINVGQVTAVPTKIITGTAKSGPTYSSSNTSVATVDSSGKVTGKAAGTATITISYTNYDGTTATKTCSVTVYAKVTITAFSYSSTNVDVGKTTAMPTKTITGTAKSGPTYSSSNTNVATVNSSTGVVTGVEAGTATITIKYTNYDGTTTTKTCNIVILDNGELISSGYVANNGTITFSKNVSSAIVKNYSGYSNGSYTEGNNWSWSCSRNTVKCYTDWNSISGPILVTFSDGKIWKGYIYYSNGYFTINKNN